MAAQMLQQSSFTRPCNAFPAQRTAQLPLCIASRQRIPRQRDLTIHAVAQETTSSLLSSSTASLFEAGGPGAPQPGAAEADVGKALDDVQLPAQSAVDYVPLRDALKAGEFEKADDITRALLIQLAGEDAVTRGWVYFTEVKFIPEADMIALDQLWSAASGGLFGYKVQRELWMQNKKMWTRFFQVIDWVQGENNVYRKWPMEFTYSLKAAKGHLPLTNALRGTRLFEAIMEHPAFEKQQTEKPGWLK